MRSIILAATVLCTLLGASAADAKSEKGCRAKGTCEPGAIQACAAQWKTAKADEAVKAKGWIPFWSACAKEAKVARTVAP